MASSGSDTRRGGAVDGYQPSLDGVRALAVTAVLLYHAGVPWLPGGFLGVDAFFVLSGFLITSLLLAERARQGRVRLVAFWGRRARRLLPAALVMLAGTAIAGRYLLPPLDLGLLRGDEFAAIGYVANWRMIYRGADYFAQTAAASPVQHTWSLSIEEQFYLVWPLLLVAVLALRRRSGRRLLLTLACAGALASAVTAALLYHPTNPNRAYFGTDSRAQALLVGCALALLLARSPARDAAAPAAGVPAQAGPPALEAAAAPARHRVLGLLAGLGALVFAVECWRAGGSSGWLYRGGLALCALAVAAVLAHATRSPGSPTARLLSLVPLVWLGRISYGVYLYHWPLFEYLDAGRTGLSGLGLLALRLAAVLVMATLSYHLIEQPIRRGRWLRVARPVIPAGAALLAAAATAELVLVATVPPAQPSGPVAPVAAVAPPVTPSAPGQPALPPPVRRAGRAPGAQPRVDIFGDSVAWTIGAYLPAHPGLTVTTRAIQGCGITLEKDILELGAPHTLYPYCPTWPGRYQAGVNADDPDVSVLLLNRWELMDARYDGAYEHVGEADFDGYLLGQLDQAVRIVGSRGARVVLLTAAYTHRAEQPDGSLYPEDQPARVDAWNALLTREAAAHPGQVVVLNLNALVCPGGRYTASVGGLQIRSDGLHFTPAGVQRLIAPWLLPQLTSLATTGQP